MDAIHAAEIAVNLLLQSLGAWLAAPMRLVSLLGQEEFFIILMPVVYWCVDASTGLRVGIMLLFTNFANTFFKLMLHGPRPYWIDTRVHAYGTETSFGVPSGHSQTAASVWGLLAVSLKKRWAVTAAILLIFLIGLSRLYLGVHFLTDVLTGWLIGGLLLLVFVAVEPAISAWVSRRSLAQQIGLAALSSVGLILISMMSLAIWPGYLLPASWVSNASAAAPGVTLNPLDINGLFTVGGTWFGFLAGAAWLWKTHGKFNASGTPRQYFLRYLIGLAGVLLFYSGLGILFPRTLDLAGYLLRYLRYVLVGVWISALSPLVFARLGLLAFRQTTAREGFQSAENPL